MARKILAAFFAAAFASAISPRLSAAEDAHSQPTPPRQTWSFAGPFGKYDQAQLQRGFKVYSEVCLQCHAMKLLSYRNLADPGGPGYSPAQAAAVAADYTVQTGYDDSGKPITRPAQVADPFPPAKASIPNTTPPDLSVIAKARTYERGFPWFILDGFTQFQEQGVDYIVAYLTGFEDPPVGTTMAPGTYYNKYFPGHATAMPKPALMYTGNGITYDDGTPPSPEQNARDVAAFLMWAAEPHLDARKRIGFQVMLFLIVFAGLVYFTKKRVWSAVKGHA
jgi:cytochrome c1